MHLGMHIKPPSLGQKKKKWVLGSSEVNVKSSQHNSQHCNTNSVCILLLPSICHYCFSDSVAIWVFCPLQWNMISDYSIHKTEYFQVKLHFVRLYPYFEKE